MKADRFENARLLVTRALMAKLLSLVEAEGPGIKARALDQLRRALCDGSSIDETCARYVVTEAIYFCLAPALAGVSSLPFSPEELASLLVEARGPAADRVRANTRLALLLYARDVVFNIEAAMEVVETTDERSAKKAQRVAELVALGSTQLINRAAAMTRCGDASQTTSLSLPRHVAPYREASSYSEGTGGRLTVTGTSSLREPAARVVHADLKPSNILFRTSDSEVVLTDFGLANVRAIPASARLMQVINAVEVPAPVSPAGGSSGMCNGAACDTCVADVNESGLDSKDIDIVCEQTGVPRARAVQALRDNDGDIVNAIMEITE